MGRCRKTRGSTGRGRTVTLVVREYGAHCEAYNRPSTVRRKKIISQRVREHFGRRKIQSITPRALAQYIARRRNERAAAGTVNREISYIKHLIAMAARWGRMSRSAAEQIREVPLLREPPGRERVLAPHEEATLFRACHDRLRALLQFALLTGMREDEIVSLQWREVDLDNRILLVLNGKGGKSRPIPLSRKAVRLLQRVKEWSGGVGAVFRSTTGDPWTCDGLRATFHRARRRAGIADIRIHDMRHSCATRMMQRGASVAAVQRILGHLHIRTTMRYSHMNSGDLRSAVELLDR